VEEDDLTGDLQGRQMPELLNCTAAACCQILATAGSSEIDIATGWDDMAEFLSMPSWITASYTNMC
jgi:hypothetical protein